MLLPRSLHKVMIKQVVVKGLRQVPSSSLGKFCTAPNNTRN